MIMHQVMIASRIALSAECRVISLAIEYLVEHCIVVILCDIVMQMTFPKVHNVPFMA